MVIKPELDPETDERLDRVPHKKSHTGFLLLILFLGIALTAGIVFELKQRQTQDRTLATTATEDSGRMPVVNVGHVRKAPAKSMVELPGQTVPLAETPIYARADGYIKQRPVDIGYRVKKGDLLVEIETPELDQQMEQNRATIAQSKAALEQLQAALVAARSSLKLAKVTSDRWQTLTDQGVFAKQDLDEKIAALELGQANVRAAEENVRAAQSTIAANEANQRRLENLKSFDRMVAPFDGVITARNQDSDVGTLVSSGNTTSAREIMRVGQLQTLRIFVNIPQAYAAVIKSGQPAELIVDELPGRVFHTSVGNTTHSVDSNSRTMLAVLLVDNKNEDLLPGMYAKVRFMLPHAVDLMMLPADALIVRSDGEQVAVVDADHKVHFHDVTLGRDYGAQVEIESGLADGDVVVLNPTDVIRDGVTVEPRERAK